MSDSTPSAKAMMIAAQCWCDPETAEIEMDARLAIAFAKRLDPLLDAAPENFERELCNLINRHSMEQFSNTPDWVLARLLVKTLDAYAAAVECVSPCVNVAVTPNAKEGDDE